MKHTSLDDSIDYLVCQREILNERIKEVSYQYNILKDDSALEALQTSVALRNRIDRLLLKPNKHDPHLESKLEFLESSSNK